MTFPYLHPVSLLSLLLAFWAARSLSRLSTREGQHVLELVGWGRALLVPLVPVVLICVASIYTDPDISEELRFANAVLGAVTTSLLYLAALFLTDGSSLARDRHARTFRTYRPARLKKVRPAGGNSQRNTAALLAAVALATGVFGIRFGEHLRARTLVGSLPADFGPVELRDAEDEALGEIESGGVLRPGEAMCPDLRVDLITPAGRVLRLKVVNPDDPEFVGMREHNIIENAWMCDVYLASPQRLNVPDDLWTRWKDLPHPPVSFPLSEE